LVSSVYDGEDGMESVGIIDDKNSQESPTVTLLFHPHLTGVRLILEFIYSLETVRSSHCPRILTAIFP
jgi:hypothetical protein